jgi:hypothetical protein
MCGLGGDSSDGGAAANARQQEQAREARIASGMGQIDAQFSKFTPDYYNTYAKKLTDFWAPQVTQQYKDGSNSLAFTFADTNPGGSSAATDAASRLKIAQGQSIQQNSDNAQNSANQLRQNVEGQRSSLVADLNATADPTAAAQAANAESTILSAPPAYSSLGDLFGGLTQQYANSQLAAKAGFAGLPGFNIMTGSKPAAPGSMGSEKNTA